MLALQQTHGRLRAYREIYGSTEVPGLSWWFKNKEELVRSLSLGIRMKVRLCVILLAHISFPFYEIPILQIQY